MAWKREEIRIHEARDSRSKMLSNMIYNLSRYSALNVNLPSGQRFLQKTFNTRKKKNLEDGFTLQILEV
jgi:hypothetical protein